MFLVVVSLPAGKAGLRRRIGSELTQEP